MKTKLSFILILVISLSMILSSCTSPNEHTNETPDVNAGSSNGGESEGGESEGGESEGGESEGGESEGGESEGGESEGGESEGGESEGGESEGGESEGSESEGGESEEPNKYPEPTTTPEGFGLVPESAAVDKSYFDDAAFIGDSISLKLKTYCLNGALGKANFFTVGSFSTVNALKPVSSTSTHPSYQGTKMLAEDCVAACGAKKVYIMLGMNDLTYGIDKTIERYKTLVSRILAKSPDVEIFVQSMTPMRKDSRVWGSKLNNTNIRAYNAKLLETCKAEGWYFIDVQSIMWDDAGEQMRLDYCSDAGSGNMGMHMSSKGCKAWVEYLLTHTVDLSVKEDDEINTDTENENGDTENEN